MDDLLDKIMSTVDKVPNDPPTASSKTKKRLSLPEGADEQRDQILIWDNPPFAHELRKHILMDHLLNQATMCLSFGSILCSSLTNKYATATILTCGSLSSLLLHQHFASSHPWAAYEEPPNAHEMAFCTRIPGAAIFQKKQEDDSRKFSKLLAAGAIITLAISVGKYMRG